LVDTLWPDAGISNGRASLSTTLWRLRGVFDRLQVPASDYLHSDRDWISLEPAAALNCDHSDFEQQMLTAERASGDEARQKQFLLASELYRGSFCEGIYAEWCLRERERLERLYLRAQGQLMAGYMRQKRYQEAIDAGQRVLDKDPLREEVHRALMRCYWKLGRRTAAAKQFQRCANLLQQELQILPMPETIALYRGIVEERLQELGAGYVTPGELELQVAYDKFLDAAEQLNSALDTAEVSRREPTLSAAD
jgi:DNA-binding SARP family transcriptional activator